MPRPQIEEITFSIDGREVRAPANTMLVDAAKLGDVEIPVFCYEPKLGQPVGACRMCLVEVEGIPKLQTACSTPVKDGMVVHTQTQRVHEAQRAVVEFLLINHPLDCPVCDKGGECPLQDITYGWGPGTSRFIEPKRHFQKPLELSPLIAIDRERCILCYRCVRYSQEVAEDYQLVLLERGASSYVGTFDGHPYVAPFSGNIVELCPVGALTASTYRFRARPWDVEGAGTICTLCPSQCNVELTIRDDRVTRVLARDNTEVDDGWLCDKGRFAYQHTHADERITTPLLRQGNSLTPVSWDTAVNAAASALRKAGAKAAALAGGETTNEEAFLLTSLFRDGLGSDELSSSPYDGFETHPSLQATVADLEFAHAVLVLDCDPIDEAPIWDLRIRKGVRRRGVRLVVASARPTALDANAAATMRFAPGATEAALVALGAAVTGDTGSLGGAASSAGTNATAVQDLVAALKGEDIVIVASERTLSTSAGAALVTLAQRLGLADRDGAGLLVIPSSTNGRGLADVGLGGAPAAEIAEDLASGELSVAYLLHADPLSSHPDRELWNRALSTAQTVIAHESVLTETVLEHADIVFPAEAYPEKEGTITHPDGRLQRLRVAIGRPGALEEGVRATWSVIAEVAKRAGHDPQVIAGPIVTAQLLEVSYPGVSLDSIGGQGVRPTFEEDPLPAPGAPAVPSPVGASGGLRLGSWRSIWASKEVEVSPALQFLRPLQVVELSPADAGALGVEDGEVVEVSAGSGSVQGVVRLRAAVPPGSVFVMEGVAGAPANALGSGPVSVSVVDDEAPVEEPVAVLAGGDAAPEAPEAPALEPPPGTGVGQSNDGATPDT